MKVDLHVHSTYSDGSLEPQEIIDIALNIGINAMSITDHDNVLSFDIAKQYAQKKADEGSPLIEIIPGVEVNTIWKDYEIHVLGYFMNFDDSDFQNMLKYQQHARVEQTHKIVELLNKKEGIKVTFDHIKSLVAEGGSIGRPHIARAITSAGGTANVIEAYSKFINDNSPVYVRRNTVSPFEAVEIIYDAGGIPVIAHPHDIDIAEELIKNLVNYGLRGVEAYHRKHSPAMVEYYSSIAERLGLIVTGGSDFHSPSPNGQYLLGKNFVPEWVLDELKAEKRRIELAK